MVKVVEAICHKSIDRIEDGKGTKLDTLAEKWAKKFVDKHPKISSFIVQHEEAINITFDILFAVDMIWLGYNMGKGALYKDLAGPIPANIDSKLVNDGKTLVITASGVTKKGLAVTRNIGVSETPKLMTIANQAIESLHNNGVDFHTI